MRFFQTCALVLPLVLLAACDGDDDASSTTTTGSTTSGTPTGSGGGGNTGGGPGNGTGGGGTGGGDTGSGGNGTGGGGGGMSWEGVDPIANIEPATEVANGFQFTEGTCWFPAEGVLRFTDIPNSTIHEVDGQGLVTVWRNPSGKANGLAVAPNGDLLAAEHQNRRVTRSASSDMIEVVADTYQGMQLNSPNDVIVRSDGNVYFTDPTYGLEGAPQQLPFQGVFRVAPDGTVSLVGDVFDQPNGIALSPDEQTLYVTDSAASELHAFPVNADGSTGPGQKMLDTGMGPDGMAVDDGGNLYLTVEGGVQVLRSDGTQWGTIPVPEKPTNCAFGDADRRTLYISAQGFIYKVRLNVPGKP